MNQLTSYANFTEQQSINSSMTSLASSFSSLVTLNSVNYIGHTVEAKTDTSTLSNGSATYGYSLSSAAANVSISIKDSSGKTVWTGTGTGNAGSNSFTWDGKDSSGTQLADGGKYTHVRHRDRLRRKLGFQLRHRDRQSDRDRRIDQHAIADGERRFRQRQQHHRRHVLTAFGVRS